MSTGCSFIIFIALTSNGTYLLSCLHVYWVSFPTGNDGWQLFLVTPQCLEKCLMPVGT